MKQAAWQYHNVLYSAKKGRIIRHSADISTSEKHIKTEKTA